ncbi:MAG: 2,3-bisphosphoglycerate-independent phosphoglycerate mutase [Phycisphaerae bacterium]|nr:2,3-bisphosphoglycerate-independent phosphoglycerate mutase [Phycisphaerae bacterium]
MTRPTRRPFVLIIRDGWGHSYDHSLDPYNAILQADTPVNDALLRDYPNVPIHTSGEWVGLPDGTMGNSEVGHQNIGAGRVVDQESVRITKSIRVGEFFGNPVALEAVKRAKSRGGKLHVMGLASDIGVHSLLNHVYGILELAKRNALSQVYIHAFTDGRDSPPQSGKAYLEAIAAKAREIGVGRIATVTGRYWAMDRDNRWDRVQKAYRMLRYGEGAKAADPIAAMQASYDGGVTDEFIEPTIVTGAKGEPLATVEDGDSVIFFNFRGDRPREITKAFVQDDFSAFDRGRKLDLYYATMSEYEQGLPVQVIFPRPPKMTNIFGEYLSKLGLTEFRCAETEKYAHVTFFFNDYREEPFPGEDRKLIPSPKVDDAGNKLDTYDKKPAMSAPAVGEAVAAAIDTGQYDAVVVNFANCDMVGHTGVMEAAVKAVETVDRAVGLVLDAMRRQGGVAIVTADHGNAEQMYDPTTHGPHTAHTVGDVDLIVVDDRLKGPKVELRKDGTLADVIPTGLELMGLPQPAEMTGASLLKK